MTQNANGAVTNRQENMQLFSEGSLVKSLRSKVAIVNKKFYNATSNMQNISKMVVQIDSYNAEPCLDTEGF